MGIDIDHRFDRVHKRRAPKSNDPYLLLLVKLYRFLGRRTSSPFNKVILRRLCLSRTNRPPVSLAKLNKLRGPKPTDKQILVVVGKIVNDDRLLDVPKMDVCALRFSQTARDRIHKAGGRTLTFDQLALERPTGANTVLIQGRRTARESYRHFRNYNGRHFAPHVRGNTKTGRKHERSKFRRGK